jgi:hypothetical protein
LVPSLKRVGRFEKMKGWQTLRAVSASVKTNSGVDRRTAFDAFGSLEPLRRIRADGCHTTDASLTTLHLLCSMSAPHLRLSRTVFTMPRRLIDVDIVPS